MKENTVEGGSLVIWILYLLIHFYAEFGSDTSPRLSPETKAHRERLRQERERKRMKGERLLLERERKRLEALRQEEAAAMKADEEAELRARRKRETREAAERKALEAEYARREADAVVFENAAEAYPEMPSVSLREDEPPQADAVAAS